MKTKIYYANIRKLIVMCLLAAAEPARRAPARRHDHEARVRDGAVLEAHVVAPARTLGRVDARCPTPALHAHALARERAAQHVEHARRLVRKRIEPALALLAPHKPEVGEEGVHGIGGAGRACGGVRRRAGRLARS